MKTKKTGIIAIIAIALLAGWNIVQEKDNVQLSDLALENLEALAGCEVNGWMSGNYHITIYSGCAWNCSSGGVLSCPI